MKKSKENGLYKTTAGITLISLIIIVILMLIIAGVAIRNGLQSADNVELQKFFSELQVIQKRVDVISKESKSGINDKITYDASTQIYEDRVGKNIHLLEDESQKQKVENLKNKNEIYHYDAQSYVQSGKVFQLDGWNNLKIGSNKNLLVWEDLSSNNYRTTIFNDPNWNENGSGMHFRGDDTYIQIENPIKNCDQFTIEILVQPDSPESGRDIITFDTGLNARYTAPRLEKTDQNEIYQWYNGGIFSEGTTITMSSGKTHLITITVDENKAKLYHNGKLEYEQDKLTDETVERLKVDYINICNQTIGNTGYFKGDIYAIRMYEQALSQSQVGKNYLVDANRFPDQNLVIDDGTGSSKQILNDYYYYTPEQLKEIGIENIKQDVLINWETRDVVSVDGMNKMGKTYYRDPSTYKPEYQGTEKKRAMFKIDVTEGKAVKTVKVMHEPQEGEKTIDNFVVKYKLEEEENWTTAKENSFQTAIPGKYEIQISTDTIVTVNEKIELKPTFEIVKKEIISSPGQWKYTISEVFGNYKYPNVIYYYKPSDTEDVPNAWVKVEGNTFIVMDEKDYEIKVLNEEDNSEIDSEIIMSQNDEENTKI